MSIELGEKYKYTTIKTIEEVETSEKEKEEYGVATKKVNCITYECPICKDVNVIEHNAITHSISHELDDLKASTKFVYDDDPYFAKAYFETKEQVERFIQLYDTIEGSRYLDFKLKWDKRGWYRFESETKNWGHDDERDVRTFVYSYDDNVEKDELTNSLVWDNHWYISSYDKATGLLLESFPINHILVEGLLEALGKDVYQDVYNIDDSGFKYLESNRFTLAREKFDYQLEVCSD